MDKTIDFSDVEDLRQQLKDRIDGCTQFIFYGMIEDSQNGVTIYAANYPDTMNMVINFLYNYVGKDMTMFEQVISDICLMFMYMSGSLGGDN